MSKEIYGRMRKFIDELEAEHTPASPEQMAKADVVQNAMNMGSQSPNSANLSDDAENKDQGGFQDAEKRKKSFVAMYKA